MFGRENYEYYARLTGRILKVEDEWIFFTYPLDNLQGVRTDIDIDCRPGFRSSHHDVVDSTGSLEMIPENCPLDPSGRLSISLDTEHCMSSLESRREAGAGSDLMVGVRSSTLDPRRTRASNNSEAKSFVCLPQVEILRLAPAFLCYKDTTMSCPTLILYGIWGSIIDPFCA